MEWKVPTSYCVHCGDLKRLCHCSKKLTTVKRLESDKVELSEEENRREINGVDASTLVSDKVWLCSFGLDKF